MNRYREILKQYWGYDFFRPLQEEIIASIGEGRDTLGLMPTGGGKSITFQVPALAQEGLCIVVTPLIALMKDQVQHLRQREIKATAIYSGMTRQEIITALENCIFGDYKFLYISPERLGTEIFRTKLRAMKVSMITVDESHCISQWGYDFRPAYLKIAEIRTLLPGVPVLALTATATPKVVMDIQRQLNFAEENVFRMSFERKNLAYIVHRTEDKEGEMFRILHSMEGSAIVYTRNRRSAQETATLLMHEGISADYYHAGLDNAVKDHRQKRWQTGEVRVMVATNAFGMGIDKSDVRLVLHTDLPDSPEAYFQEAGRAGRDGQKAYSVVLYSRSDKPALRKRIADTFPPKEYILHVYELLQYFFQMAMGDGFQCVREFDLDKFCRQFKLFPVPTHSALKILTQAGYLEYTDEKDNTSRLCFLLRRDELYRLQGEDPETDLLLQTLLRRYSGFFSDYTYISEENLALHSGLDANRVYELLKALSHRRVVDYVPRRKTPYIIYTRERMELRYLFLSPTIYEERKQRYEERIRAMEEYVTSEEECRSRMLLRYFGEQSEQTCGVCDVCRRQLAETDEQMSELRFAYLSRQIMELLSSQPQTPHALAGHTGQRLEDVSTVVRHLLDEGALKIENGLLQISKIS